MKKTIIFIICYYLSITMTGVQCMFNKYCEDIRAEYPLGWGDMRDIEFFLFQDLDYSLSKKRLHKIIDDMYKRTCENFINAPLGKEYILSILAVGEQYSKNDEQEIVRSYFAELKDDFIRRYKPEKEDEVFFTGESMWKIQEMALRFRENYGKNPSDHFAEYLGKLPTEIYDSNALEYCIDMLKTKYADYVNNTIMPFLRTIKETRLTIDLN